MADIIKKRLKAKINGVTQEVYPYTHVEAVVDDNGNTLKDTLQIMADEIDAIASGSSEDVPDGVAYVDFTGNNTDIVNLKVNADMLNGYSSDDFVKTKDLDSITTDNATYDAQGNVIHETYATIEQLDNVSVDGMVYVNPNEEGTNSDIIIENGDTNGNSDRHHHINKEVLDRLSASEDGSLLFDGEQIGANNSSSTDGTGGSTFTGDASTLDGHDSTYFATSQSVVDALEAAKKYNDDAYANSNAYTDTQIANLINGAPTTLDTLKEIADAMEENEDIVNALNEAIGEKATQAELDTHTGNDTIHITTDERTEWSNKVSQEELQEALDNISDGTTPVGNALKLNGLTAEEFVNNENLLDNAYFPDAVNSSGKTSWNGNGTIYVFDKWILEGTTSVTLTLSEDGAVISLNGASYGSLVYDTMDMLVSGEKYTISVKYNGQIYSKTFAGGGYITGGSALNDTLKLFYLSSNGRLYLRTTATDSAVFEWVKLEIGSVATPFIPPNKEVEKLKCGIVKDVDVESAKFLRTWSVNKALYGEDTWLIRAMYSKLGESSFTLYAEHMADGSEKAVKVAEAINADTVDGKHASDFVNSKSQYMDGTDTILNWANNPNGIYKKFALSGYGIPTDAPVNKEGFLELFVDQNDRRKKVTFRVRDTAIVYTRDILDGAWIDEWSTGYLPLDGSKPMSGALKFSNEYGRLKAANGEWLTIICNEVADDTNISNCRYIQLNTAKHNATKGNIRKALQLREIVDDNETSYDILHTGNSAPCVVTDTDLEVGSATSYADGTIIFVKETT